MTNSLPDESSLFLAGILMKQRFQLIDGSFQQSPEVRERALLGFLVSRDTFLLYGVAAFWTEFPFNFVAPYLTLALTLKLSGVRLW
ncbi:MAG: hypothetical protein M1395_05290 [Bacteroidetes bacterium]|nr:hypothetical protein [Bacteroidota bacterium]